MSKKTNFRLLFLDIDGTLLFKEYDTSVATWDYLKLLEKRGVKISLMTARPYALSVHITNKLSDEEDIHSFDGGGFVANTSGNKVISKHLLKPEAVSEIMSILKPSSDPIRFGLSTGRDFYTNDIYYRELSSYLPIDFIHQSSQFDINNVSSVWSRDVDEGKAEIIRNKFGNDMFVGIHDNGLGKHSVFVKCIECSKENSIDIITDRLQINKGLAVMIGDGPEDIVSMTKVGFSGVPGNATQEVKSTASFVSEKLYSEGLNEILLKIWPDLEL